MNNGFDYSTMNAAPWWCWVIFIPVFLLSLGLVRRERRKEYPGPNALRGLAAMTVISGALLAYLAMLSVFSYDATMTAYDTPAITHSIQQGYKVDSVTFDNKTKYDNITHSTDVKLVSSVDHKSYDCQINDSAVTKNNFSWSHFAWNNHVHSNFRCFTDANPIQKR